MLLCGGWAGRPHLRIQWVTEAHGKHSRPMTISHTGLSFSPSEKDAANKKSNQSNLGIIKCSNLCTEVMEYTNSTEVAVCNLGSLCLPRFVTDARDYDYEHLYRVTKVLARNLDRVIDINYYPVPEASSSNERHRPIGIGV